MKTVEAEAIAVFSVPKKLQPLSCSKSEFEFILQKKVKELRAIRLAYLLSLQSENVVLADVDGMETRHGGYDHTGSCARMVAYRQGTQANTRMVRT